MTQQRTEEEGARIRLAAELRSGMHLLVKREPPVELLTEVADDISAVFAKLADSPGRTRGPMSLPVDGAGIKIEPPADGEEFPDSLDRPVSGSGNPFSVPMTMTRDGEHVVSTVTLDAGFEGAPGRSHGGFVSAIFDDLFGSLPMLQGKIAFTASLTVNYLAPSPVFEPVTFRGWIDRVDGKKISVEGTAHHGETLVTTASALFIDATDVIAALHAEEKP